MHRCHFGQKPFLMTEMSVTAGLKSRFDRWNSSSLPIIHHCSLVLSIIQHYTMLYYSISLWYYRYLLLYKVKCLFICLHGCLYVRYVRPDHSTQNYQSDTLTDWQPPAERFFTGWTDCPYPSHGSVTTLQTGIKTPTFPWLLYKNLTFSGSWGLPDECSACMHEVHGLAFHNRTQYNVTVLKCQQWNGSHSPECVSTGMIEMTAEMIPVFLALSPLEVDS